jgi:hypothetical protein
VSLRAYAGAVVTCSFCGASPASAPESTGESASAAEDPPITWTSAVENGRLRWFCDSCSREHLRAIESKLDSEWW